MDENQKTSPNNIDQIRNLIFGEQIQHYDRQFQDLKKAFKNLEKTVHDQQREYVEELKEQEKKFNQLLSDQQNVFQKELKKQEQSIKQELLSIREYQSQLSEDKLDRNQLADLLINLAMQLKGESILDQIDKGMSSNE